MPQNTAQVFKQSGTITPVASSTLYSDVIPVERASKLSFQLSWEGLVSFNARAILQCSSDNTNWNDLGGGIILDLEDDTQIWLLDSKNILYLRLELSTNNLNSGTITWGLQNYD